MNKSERPKIVLCDLDGVIWLAHQPIPGSVEAVKRLQEAGIRVLFVTNNSFSTVAEQESALAHVGIAARGEVVTSAMSAAQPMKKGQRALVCGGPGIVEALTRKGVDVVVAHEQPGVNQPFDAVVVGMHKQFTYEVLNDAQRAIRNGAVLIGSNEDPTYPTPAGPIPGGGSLLAAIAAASETSPQVTGKPHQVMADMVREICFPITATEMMMIGDRPTTDGAFARQLGCRFGLVLSGVSRGDVVDSNEIHPKDLVAPDLAAVVDALLK
jgi:4-nitrophenyl phosphatase